MTLFRLVSLHLVIPDTKQKTHQIPGWDASISNDREIALFGVEFGKT